MEAKLPLDEINPSATKICRCGTCGKTSLEGQDHSIDEESIKKPITVFVEVSAEETEMLFRALDALVDTSMKSFTCEEYEMLEELAVRINKSFKD